MISFYVVIACYVYLVFLIYYFLPRLVFLERLCFLKRLDFRELRDFLDLPPNNPNNFLRGGVSLAKLGVESLEVDSVVVATEFDRDVDVDVDVGVGGNSDSLSSSCRNSLLLLIFTLISSINGVIFVSSVFEYIKSVNSCSFIPVKI